MAHHQGMLIVAIANALHSGAMRTRFHSEPIVQASELLLQERTPRDVAASHREWNPLPWWAMSASWSRSTPVASRHQLGRRPGRNCSPTAATQ